MARPTVPAPPPDPDYTLIGLIEKPGPLLPLPQAEIDRLRTWLRNLTPNK